MSIINTRPSSVPKSAIALLLSFVLFFVLASCLCVLCVSLSDGYAGIALSMAVSSIFCFAVPGYISRRFAMGRFPERLGLSRLNVPVVATVVILSLIFQPFAEWASYANYEFCRRTGLLAFDSLAGANNAMLAHLCVFDTPAHKVVPYIVIALLPAFSEELFFRGALLPLLRRVTGSWHWAVFISAAIFSAIHLELTGFLPRLIIGIILGYVFVITKSLWASTLIHFINNALVVFVLSRADDVMKVMTAVPEEPRLLHTLCSLALVLFELNYLKGLYDKKSSYITISAKKS